MRERVDPAATVPILMPLLDTLEQTRGQRSSNIVMHRDGDSLHRLSRHEQRAAILLVEDEDTLRNAVVRMLQKRGFEVLAASDGTAAVDQLRIHGERLTLLMLDVTLPGLPSRDVLEEARRIRPGIMVVLTSAFSQNVAEFLLRGSTG
jgi:CheY-like chemotaxis protein